MTIYQSRPGADILIPFGFTRFPESRIIRLHFEDAVATYKDYPNPDPTCAGPMMNLSLSGLWNMLKAEQDLWLQQHPHELVNHV